MSEKIGDIDRESMSRHRLDRSHIITYATFGIVTVASVFLSLLGVGFDPAKIVWPVLVSNMLINDAITISMMYVADKDGVSRYESDESDVYSIGLDKLANRAWSVVKLGLGFAFSGYAHKKYKSNKEDYLRYRLQKYGLEDIRILHISNAELKSLITNPILTKVDGGDFGHDTITAEQYIVVSRLKEGKYIYDEIPAEWFLNGFTSEAADLYRYYSKSAEHKRAAARSRYAYRIIMLALISALFAASFAHEGALGDPQSYINAITMVATAIGSIASGYIGARAEVDQEAKELSFKCSFIDMFFSDYNAGVFVPENMTDVIRAKLKALSGDESPDAGKPSEVKEKQDESVV